MKTKYLISMFFHYALFMIFVGAIESFKDEKQFGEAKEFQIETVLLYRRPWIYWRDDPETPKEYKGENKGEHESSGAGAQEESEQNGVVKDKRIELDGEHDNDNNIKGQGGFIYKKY
ncbi:uncharacterized protein LOC131642170 [Vicia villosa]|uniref:uncharacterized protein LOC131642170 n=1 Tax=Vicia villosa TaxID=3911 RepID=UPI00273B26B2|nr:uncharacterized protein LOC131642170 [Vicia villosa]